MSEQANIAADIVGWLDDLLLAAEDSLDELSSETRAHAFVRGSAFAYRRVRVRLADERSASKSPNSSDPSAIAGAIERATPSDVRNAVKQAQAYVTARDFMNTAIMDFIDDHPTGASDGDPVATLGLSTLRTLLADHARLEAENARLREGLSQIDQTLTDEIAARFGHPSKGEAEVAGGSRIYHLLVVPRNMARALTNREGQDNE